jgi:uncharacterized SAM-binding protein YcdF (DUF218 family)
MARRRRIRPLRLLVRAILAVAVLWVVGLIWFAGEIGRARPEAESLSDVPTADAVVVLTGTPDRLGVGFELLAAGRAQRMFISGVYRGVDVQQILRALRRSPDEAENAVVLGYGADDTIGNAHETAVWMAKEGLTSLILVTSNFHMPRALMEFHAAMPGVTVVPHATAVASFKIDDWWRWPGTIRLIAIEWSKYVAARTRLVLGVRVASLPVVSPAPVTPPQIQKSPAENEPEAAPKPPAAEAPAPAGPPSGAPSEPSPANPEGAP